MIKGHHHQASDATSLANICASIRSDPSAQIHLVWPIPGAPNKQPWPQPFAVVWTSDDGMPAKPGPRCTNCLATIPAANDGTWAAPTNHTLRPDGSLQCNVGKAAC